MILALLVVNLNATAANDSCNPESIEEKLKLIDNPKFECLTNKEQALVKECSALHKIKISSNWRIIDPPKINCDKKIESECALSRMDRIQYEQKYGSSTKVVVELTRTELNRFNEKITKTFACGWLGDEYKIYGLKAVR